MPRKLRHGLVIAVSLVSVAMPASSVAAEDSGTSSTDTTSTTAPEYGYNLENDPDQCIGFYPKPNCGKKVTQAGDRGGALQFALLGILLAGLATIAVVIGRNIARRDREVASRISESPSDNT